MPMVQMPDGQTVNMPDRASPEQLQQLRMKVRSGAGRRMAPLPEADIPALPFLDRSMLSRMDNPDEKQAFLEHRYGKGSVSSDKKGLVVTVNGKRMRASTDVVSSFVGAAPQLSLGIAGALAGSELGPGGTIIGAGAGLAAGKTIEEGTKIATGVERKTPGEIARGVAVEGVAGAAGEGAGKALGLLRKLPLREKIFDITPETKSMTERVLKGGARPPPQSTIPSGRKFQRIAIIADKLSGPNKAIERANFGYLQDRVSGILDQAGVKGLAKSETMNRLAGSDSAMSFQQTGQVIQKATKALVDNAKTLGIKGKDLAYLQQVSATGKTPEQAWEWLVRPQETDRLERVMRLVGTGSPAAEAIQQRALRSLLADSLVRTESGEATNALMNSLKQFTPRQQKLLFPNGLADDIKLLAKETQFLFPEIKDPSMAGFTTGTIMQHAWYNRFYAQGTYAFGRAMIQKPWMIRRIAIGLKDTKTRQATKAAVRSMFYYGAMEMNNPNQDPGEIIPETKTE